MWSQSTAQRGIIFAGCLGMAYTQLTMSPATIEYARSLGGSGFHIGVLGALPTAMLFAQFVAAAIANRLRYRRGLWMAVAVIQRLLLVPLACGPLLFTQVSDAAWLWGFVLATAANHALLHFCMPLWLSWMGDYLPHQGLSRFWGTRHLWMQWAGAAALLGGALFVFSSDWSVKAKFCVLVCAGAFFGVADVLVFLKVEEPPVSRAPKAKRWDVLSAPFRERGFRSYIAYACFWNFAAMLGAPFISLYLLSHVGVSLFQLLLLWTFSWVGGALLAGRLGRLADKFGNRPLLILCTSFKSLNMIALLAAPANPVLVFWVLIPVFMIDALLNAGIAIATNGFLLKNSPRENRTMYIAAGTAAAGMIGGFASIAGGVFLAALAGWQVHWGDGTFNAFHLLFATSLVLRLVSVQFARRIREPESHGAVYVATQLIGVTPLRVLRFPVGFYRSVPAPQPQRSVSETEKPVLAADDK